MQNLMKGELKVLRRLRFKRTVSRQNLMKGELKGLKTSPIQSPFIMNLMKGELKVLFLAGMPGASTWLESHERRIERSFSKKRLKLVYRARNLMKGELKDLLLPTI